MQVDSSMNSDLVRIHHAEYEDDIPFWTKHTEGFDPILEIGCGHGRVTLPLLASGRVMVGVDNDSESLSYLNTYLEEVDDDRLRISLIQADILDYQPKASFGGVIIPCNTYSTFCPESRSQLIRNIYSWLKEGGKLIASLPNPQQTEEIFSELHGIDQIEISDLETLITHPETGFPVQVSSRLRATDNSLLWDWIYDHLHSNGQVERFVVTAEHFPRTQEEILAELGEGGFSDVVCQGDYTGEQFSVSSPYLILICRK